MRTDAAYADERLTVLTEQMINGSDADVEAAAAEINRIARQVWRHEPQTIYDLRDLALIARSYLDLDDAGNPIADCAESEAMVRLVQGVLRLTTS